MKELQNSVIIGRSGSGKTFYTLYYLIPRLVKTRDFVIFLNTQLELIEVKKPYTKAVVISEVKQLKNAMSEGKLIIIENEYVSEEFFLELCLEVWKLKKINEELSFCLIIDEIDLFVTKHSIPEIFKTMLTKGRRFNLSVVSITQRPQLVHNTILTQAVEFYIFTLNPHDYEYMLKFFYFKNPPLYKHVYINLRGDKSDNR